MMTNGDVVISTAGVRSPRVLYGTAWKKTQTADLVRCAIEQGFRGIDTACQPKHYEEAGVGMGVAQCAAMGVQRSDLYLQTKFTPLTGQDSARLPYDPKAPLAEQVAQSFKTSSRNLQTHCIDCLVLHSPISAPDDGIEVWQAMERLVDSGGVRQLGISNCYDLAYLETLHNWARLKPAVVQNRFYAGSGYDRDIRQFCRKHRIIYQGFWTLTANPQLLIHNTVARLATRYQRTSAQIVFRYLTQNDVVPLIGTTSAAHMREDLSIFEFELTAGEQAAVTALL